MVRSGTLPQAEKFKYLMILFISDGTSIDGRIDWGLVKSHMGVVLICCGKEGVTAFDLLVHLCSNTHLWSQDLGRNLKNKAVLQVSFLPRVTWFSCRDEMRSSYI